MKVTTGFGYFKDKDGHIVSKYNLPIGEHPLRPNYTFIELENRSDLNNIIIYKPPKTIKELQDEKIGPELTKIAKASLIAKGEWPT